MLFETTVNSTKLKNKIDNIDRIFYFIYIFYCVEYNFMLRKLIEPFLLDIDFKSFSIQNKTKPSYHEKRTKNKFKKNIHEMSKPFSTLTFNSYIGSVMYI